MAVMIDIPGVGQVEAKNAASESTLRELVSLMGRNARGGSAGGAGGAGGAAAGLQGLGKSAGGVSKMMGGAMKAGLNMHVGALKLAATGAIKAGEGLLAASAASAKLISDFANVGDSLTNAAGTLNNIPVIGGTLGAVLGAVAGAAEGVLTSFKQGAASGATFNGSIGEMSRAASQAGMTLLDFSALIGSSGEGLLAFGSTTEGGAKNFAALSREVRSTSSDLYAMGFGTKEINEGLVAYGKQMRMQGRSGTMTNAQLAAGAKGYMKELDLLSKVTGKSRKAIEDQMEATAADGQFRAAMAGLGPDVESSANSLINSMPTKELQDFAKDLLANGTATTENSRALMAQFPQLSAQFTALHKQTQSNVAISKEQSNQIMNIGRKEGPAALKRIKTAAAADESLHGVAASAAAFGRVNENGVLQGIKDQKNAAKATDGQVKALEEAKASLAAFSNNFQMALANSGLLDLLMDSFSFLANIVQSYVIPAFNILTPILGKIFYGMQALLMPIIEALSGSMANMEGIVSFIDSALNVTFQVFDAIVRATIPVVEGLYNGVMRVLQPLLDFYGGIFNGVGGLTTFTDIIIEAGSMVGGAFEFLGEIIGTAIEAIAGMYKAGFDFIMKFEFVRDIISAGGDAIKTGFDTLKMYLSADGAKLLMAQVKDFLVNAIGGFFLDLQDYFEDFFVTLQNALPNVLGGISDEEAAQRRKAIEERKKDREKEAALDAKHIENLKGAAMTTAANKQLATEAAKDANKTATKEFSQRQLNIKKLGGINDAEAGVRKDALKGKEDAVKNFSDPIQLLMAEAKQQSASQSLATGKAVSQPGQLKTPEAKASAAAATAKTGVEAKAMEKVAEEQKAKESAKESAKPTPTETPGSTPAPGQTSGQTAIAQLNTSIEELVRLMTPNNSLTSEQSSGLSRLAGSVTGDLFQI